ncbi:hypothetical protein [Mycobacterium sp.]|uniref:hypothetical protein n=1 Tax=Mycobacterium sp. TaxID=1785 RepID=UPI003D0EC67F
MSDAKAGNASNWVAGKLPGATVPKPTYNGAESTPKIRVAHVGTGRAGAEVLKAILACPELELVALWATSDLDVGRDAGELIGLDPVGVAAVNSLEAALAAGPDVLCHCEHGLGREEEVVHDSYFALERGVNVITTSLFPMIVPAAAPRALRRPLKDAAIVGQVSFVATGLNPGFATDLLPSALLAVSNTVEHIEIREIGHYDRYEAESVIRGVMGFGQLPDQAAPVFDGPFAAYSGDLVRHVADRLGLDVDEVIVSTEAATHDTDLQTSVGTMRAGTVVARRLSCEGRSGGRAVINTDHVTRVSRNVAPMWPQFDGAGEVSYRVTVVGDPSVRAEFAFGKESDAPGPPVVTALRIVDLIPALVEAGPGVVSGLDLTPRPRRRSLAPQPTPVRA